MATENQDATERKQRKKGTGKKKIDVTKMIENINNRRVTFTKRRDGLFKKAAQLSSMTGCKVTVLVFSNSMKPFLYGQVSDLEQAAAAAVENKRVSLSNVRGKGVEQVPLQAVFADSTYVDHCDEYQYHSGMSSGSMENNYYLCGDQAMQFGSSGASSSHGIDYNQNGFLSGTMGEQTQLAPANFYDSNTGLLMSGALSTCDNYTYANNGFLMGAATDQQLLMGSDNLTCPENGFLSAEEQQVPMAPTETLTDYQKLLLQGEEDEEKEDLNALVMAKQWLESMRATKLQTQARNEYTQGQSSSSYGHYPFIGSAPRF